MTAVVVPESPAFMSPPPSPSPRAGESSVSRHQAPRFLHDPSPDTLSPLLEEARMLRENGAGKGKGNDLRTRLVLRHALRWVVERGDVELVGWLIGLRGEWATILDEEVRVMEDDDGWGIVGMAIQSSCGRQETEEIVRQAVSRWGIAVGSREGRDHNGWTPLHLAGLISTPPLISFLLNRGASSTALTHRGLTPLDLVSGLPERADIAVFLEHGEGEMAAESGTLCARRRAMLERRRHRTARRLWQLDRAERECAVEREKERWVRDMAAVVEISPGLLLPPRVERGETTRSSEDNDWAADVESDGEEDAVEDQLLGGPPDGEESMLVFSLIGLPALLDTFITEYRTQCLPLEKKSVPANAIYLYARFAFYRCDTSWLEELLDGVIERIEQGVYSNAEDLAYLAFWAYNTTLLLHLLKLDQDLARACESVTLNLLGMMQELIHAIHVFIIRVAERRIDAIMDAALLDHEPLEDFNDVRFEGEWTLFRSFGTKRRKEPLPKASQIFAGANSVINSPEPAGSSSPSLLGSLRQNVAAVSPSRSTPARESSDPRPVTNRTLSIDSVATVTPSPLLSPAIAPGQITDILSAVMMVLQLYEVNPAVTIQAFSQIYFWIACELFNRILTRKKYLCRSKAVQIRMNITLLEDWIRANGLPIQIAMKYFEPVNQLLTWLQCLSQVRDFDTLIGTMQNLKSINPFQMRRAVREYRYEVNEGRMSDECAQYLAQLQKDWERRRVDLSVDAGQRDPGLDPTSTPTPIDDLFEEDIALPEFVPPPAPICLGELLDSRYMLPFILPTRPEHLVATPPTGAAFANANLHAVDGAKTSRPSSRSSYASARPMGWAAPHSRRLRQLPSDFFTWLEEKGAQRRYQPIGIGTDEGSRWPASKSDIDGLPLQATIRQDVAQTKGIVIESVNLTTSDRTPATPSRPASLEERFHSPGIRPSNSIDRLREASRVPFEPVAPGQLRREESFEMKLRPSLIKLDGTTTGDGSAKVICSPTSPLYRSSRAQLANGSPGSRNRGLAEAETGSPRAKSDEGRRWWGSSRSVSSASTVKPDSSSPISRRAMSEDAETMG